MDSRLAKAGRTLPRGVRATAVLAVTLASFAACAPAERRASTGGDYPPPGQCPQPRFTGKAPEPIRGRENPLPDSPEHRAAGRRLYLEVAEPECAACHGRTGDGEGPLASQFAPRPRNFACAETVRGIPDGQLFWIIRNGSPGTAMPGYGDQLTEQETWQLVRHLRRLAR